MEHTAALSFLILGITSLVFFIKKREIAESTIVFLLTVATTFLVAENFNNQNEGKQVAYSLVLFLSMNFLLSKIEKLRKLKFIWIIPFISLSVLMFFGSKTFIYNDYGFNFFSLPVLFLPVFGVIAIPVARWKGSFFANLTGVEEKFNLENVIFLFFVGFAAFIGSYFVSSFGVFLIAIGFIANLFYQEGVNRNIAVSLLLIAMVSYFPKIVGIEVIDLSLGKTLEGIFLGAFTVYFLHVLAKTKRNFLLIFSFGTILCFVFIFALLLLFTQKSDLGGVDAFVGVMVGISLAIILIPEFRFSEMVFSFTIAGGLVLSPMLINEEEQQLTKFTIGTDSGDGETDVKPFEMKGQALDSIAGTYRIKEETAQLNFQLGPKGGITKGAFKTFSGNIEIGKEVENSFFIIELPLDKLTTFNNIRDESLHEENYFNSKKYPVINYVSTKLKKEDDTYILQGNFTMKGITKPLEVTIKYIGKFDSNGKMIPVIVGNSSVDRTLFGMKPDSKEGNVVDFEFKIELEKNEL